MAPLHVLLVAFHYPPEVSGGVPRMLSMEDFLVRQGCRVTILTHQDIDRGQRGGDILTVPLPACYRPAGAPIPERRPLIRRLAKRWLLLPDVFILYARKAAKAALRSARRDRFDLVITSSPPESMHHIGRRLQKALKVPWLADFCDGWTFEPLREEASLPLRSSLERFMERRLVRAADWITTATRPMRDDFTCRYSLDESKLHFLPPAFDRFVESGEEPPADAFRMVYTGRFSLSNSRRSPLVFAEGLRAALRSSEDFARHFTLEIIGDLTGDEAAFSRSPEFDGHVFLSGPRDLDRAQKAAATATMNLLVTAPGMKSVATRKLFDYLAARRPIFALAEGNEAERILRETKAGMCVSPESPRAVAAALLDAFRLWRNGRLEEVCPCDSNALYLAEGFYRRVFEEVVLARLERRGKQV